MDQATSGIRKERKTLVVSFLLRCATSARGSSPFAVYGSPSPCTVMFACYNIVICIHGFCCHYFSRLIRATFCPARRKPIPGSPDEYSGACSAVRASQGRAKRIPKRRPKSCQLESMPHHRSVPNIYIWMQHAASLRRTHRVISNEEIPLIKGVPCTHRIMMSSS